MLAPSCIDQISAMPKVAEVVQTEYAFRFGGQWQNADQNADIIQECLHLLSACVTGDAGYVFYVAAPATEWKTEWHECLRHSGPHNAHAHDADREIFPLVRGQHFPYTVSGLFFVFVKTAIVAKDSMSDIFGHLDRHSGIFKSEDRDIYINRMAHGQQGIDPGSKIEYRFQSGSVLKQ